LVLAVVLGFIVSGQGVAEAASAGTLQSWIALGSIPSAQTTGGPALANYDGDLYAAWGGELSPTHIWYSVYDGTSWTAQAEVPQALTMQASSPALGVYGGNLYLAWLGPSNPHHIWYSTFDGSTWSAQAEVPGAEAAVSTEAGQLVASSAALATFNGELYVSWIGKAAPYKIWYSAFNGSTWTKQTTIPSATAAYVYPRGSYLGYGADAALGVSGGYLFASWTGLGKSCNADDYEYCIYSAEFNGSVWTSPYQLNGPPVGPDPWPASGTAIVIYQNQPYVTWFDSSNEDMWYTAFFTSPFPGWSTPQAIQPSNSGTCNAPALADYGGNLYGTWMKSPPGGLPCYDTAGTQAGPIVFAGFDP
jgi:hypothetical protein